LLKHTPQTLGQTGQHADDQLHSYPFAMKDGAMMLWKVAVTGGTVELPPWTTVRMPCTVREERRVQLSVE
jgi:hypothetical protein